MGQEKQEESPLKGKPVVVHGLGTSSRSQPIHTLTKASFELYTICGRGPKQISNAETITRDGHLGGTNASKMALRNPETVYF